MTAEEHAALDLYLTFEEGGHDHFSVKLYELIMKADFSNRRRIKRAFPVHVEMYEQWMATPTPGEFYDKYDVKLHLKRGTTG